MTGREVAIAKISNETEEQLIFNSDVSHLTPGTYFYIIYTNEGSTVNKFFKE